MLEPASFPPKDGDAPPQGPFPLPSPDSGRISPRHLAHHHYQAEREETPEGSMELWAQAGNHSPSVGSVPASLSLLPWGQGHPRQWGCHWQGGVAVFRAGRGALSPHLQMEHLYLS